MDFAQLNTTFDSEVVAPEALLEKFNYIRAKNLVQLVNENRILPHSPGRVLVISPFENFDLHLLSEQFPTSDIQGLGLQELLGKEFDQNHLLALGQFDHIIIRWEDYLKGNLERVLQHQGSFLKTGGRVHLFHMEAYLKAPHLPYCSQFYRRLQISRAFEFTHLTLGDRVLQYAPHFLERSGSIETQRMVFVLNKMDTLRKVLIEFSVEKRNHRLPLDINTISQELQTWFRFKQVAPRFAAEYVAWSL